MEENSTKAVQSTRPETALIVAVVILGVMFFLTLLFFIPLSLGIFGWW